MERFEIGEKVSLQIVAISNDTIFLDLSAKSEGILDASELQDENGICSVKEGDKIAVYFIGSEKGEMRFTTKISGNNADKSMIENAFQNEIPVEGNVSKEIKGGYEIIIGQSHAFCPYSQMGYRQKGESSSFIGKHLTFKITEYKNDGRDILVSNRIILEEEHKKEIEKLKEKYIEGTIIEAKVLSFQSYGAFVDIGGFEALLPISEVSLGHITDISKVLEIGQLVKVKILKTDWEHERVSVSMKQLLKNPWDDVLQKYKVGAKYEGVISRIVPYGIFVELEAGIDGLVHISELDGVDRNSNLSKIFTKGSKMTVSIKEINESEQRISLTQTTSQEQDISTFKYMSNQNDSTSYNPFASLLK